MRKLTSAFILVSILLFASCKTEDLTPYANFSFVGDSNNPAPCEVTFTNSSTNATTYSWEFGDGQTSKESSPKHTYTTPGTFSVKLTATGSAGSNSTTKSITIQSPLPTPNFTFTGDNKPAPCEVTFTNSSTNATTYLWEFGDGASGTDLNPKHTYTTGGTFTVKLTATGKGGVNSTTKSVVIQNPVPNPVANFSFTENGNFAPSSVAFTNTSTNGSTYVWDFGDGQTSTSQSPSHIFAAGGLFNVTLKVKNSVGVENIINKTITIKNTPTKLKINSITLTGYPLVNSAGAGWDSGSGPDMYPTITQSTGTTSFVSYRKEDMLSSYLPYTFSSGFPFTFISLDFQNTISFYDYDPIGSDENMGGYYFTVRNYMPTNGTPYPSTISISNTSSELKFTLNIEWIL